MVFVMSWDGVLNTILQELHLLGLLYVIDCDARKLKYKTSRKLGLHLKIARISRKGVEHVTVTLAFTKA